MTGVINIDNYMILSEADLLEQLEKLAEQAKVAIASLMAISGGRAMVSALKLLGIPAAGRYSECLTTPEGVDVAETLRLAVRVSGGRSLTACARRLSRRRGFLQEFRSAAALGASELDLRRMLWT